MSDKIDTESSATDVSWTRCDVLAPVDLALTMIFVLSQVSREGISHVRLRSLDFGRVLHARFLGNLLSEAEMSKETGV